MAIRSRQCLLVCLLSEARKNGCGWNKTVVSVTCWHWFAPVFLKNWHLGHSNLNGLVPRYSRECTGVAAQNQSLHWSTCDDQQSAADILHPIPGPPAVSRYYWLDGRIGCGQCRLETFWSVQGLILILFYALFGTPLAWVKMSEILQLIERTKLNDSNEQKILIKHVEQRFGPIQSWSWLGALVGYHAATRYSWQN